MPITIGSNIASLTAQRRLSDASASIGRTFERLSSGLRINRASDDAAGLAIADALRADSRVYSQAIRNVNDGFSVLNIAQGALSQLSSISTRQLELAEQAANGVYSLTQRKALDREANALVDEFNRIVQSVKFNGKFLLDDSTEELRIQAGYGIDGSVAFGLGDTLARNVGTGSFNTAAPYVTGTTPRGIATGDLNGDSKLDLVVVDYAASSVSILMGNGDGTFGARTSVPAGSVPEQVTLADFNGDGKLDFVTTDGNSTTMGVWIGNGNGTFAARIAVPAGSIGGRVASVADFNNDGLIDIIAADNDDNAVKVFFGNGNGQFRPYTSYQTGTGPEDVKTADLNGDGVLDLVTTGRTTDTISILFGNRDGSFNAATQRSVLSARALQLKDVNHDGLTDIVATNQLGSSVSVLLNSSDASFNTTIRYTTSGLSTGLEVNDMNGDGIQDLIVADQTTDSIGILIGNGDGTFKAETTAGAGGNAVFLAVGDFNGDQVNDVAVTVSDAPEVNLLLQRTTKSTSIGQLDLLTQATARESLEIARNTLVRISSELGAIGAVQSRLDVALNNLAVAKENFDAAGSRIVDADVAAESADLVRTRILQQTAAAVLGQANLAPQLAIRLLQGA